MSFFNNPYPKYEPGNKAWKSGLFSAIIVLSIFLLFQPFGFREKDLMLKIALFPVYALLAFVRTQISFQIVRQIIKKKKNWTLMHELVSFSIGIVLLTIAVQLITHWIAGDMPLTMQWYFKLLYHVASLFLFIAIIEFFFYNHRSASMTSKQIHSKYEIAQQKLNSVKTEVIPISLENEHIEIARNKLVYIQSMGNYLQFCLREQHGETSKITKRGRLQKVEKDLAPFSEFIRCHRAFIINLQQPVHLKGNMKNARVVFRGEQEQIPVSRSTYKTVKARLEILTLT